MLSNVKQKLIEAFEGLASFLVNQIIILELKRIRVKHSNDGIVKNCVKLSFRSVKLFVGIGMIVFRILVMNYHKYHEYRMNIKQKANSFTMKILNNIKVFIYSIKIE